MYKVKINDQILNHDKVTIDGYLANYLNPKIPALYSRGEALKKAKLFGGVIEFDDEMPSVVNSSIIILSGNDLLFSLKELIKSKELFGGNSDEVVNSFIYKGTIFLDLYLELQKLENENEDFKIKDDLKNQLNKLISLDSTDYILINDMCFS